jgi:hypothetical protein
MDRHDGIAPFVTGNVHFRGIVIWAVRFEASRQLSGTLAVESGLGHTQAYTPERVKACAVQPPEPTVTSETSSLSRGRESSSVEEVSDVNGGSGWLISAC